MHTNRKLLLIAYFYPPGEEIGARRPYGLAKYLPEFGWDATVLTPRRPGREYAPGAVIETEYRHVPAEWKRRVGLSPGVGVHQQLGMTVSGAAKHQSLLSRAITVAHKLVTYPDDYKGWIPFATSSLPMLARDGRMDAIISTALPVSCHLIGAQAKKILRCPWVADYRDLWCGNANEFADGFMRRFHRRLESKTIRSADALVTVSPPLAETLRDLHPGKHVESITNGFDPDDFHSECSGLDDFFSVVYTGSLYQGRRDPTPILQAFKTLFEQGMMSRNDVKIRFCGQEEAWLVQRVRELKLEGNVEFVGHVPRAEALRLQQRAQVLLLLGWDGPTSGGVYTGKLFEYLNAARPILLCGGESGSLSNLLHETGAGQYLASGDKIRNFLLASYAEYRSMGSVVYHGRRDVVDRYTHRHMAGKFATLLDAIS